MAFRLKLKPHERVIIGNAAVRNAGGRVELLIENHVPVLRESEILGPRAVRTPCERIYLALQLAYVDDEHRDDHLDAYRVLATDILRAAPSCAPALAAVQVCVEDGRLYQAIKRARLLLAHERRLTSDVR